MADDLKVEPKKVGADTERHRQRVALVEKILASHQGEATAILFLLGEIDELQAMQHNIIEGMLELKRLLDIVIAANAEREKNG